MSMQLINLKFNPKPPTIMHVDLNSCFASVEQLCDPYLRGKPIAVAAYDTPRGCIIAPSIEAKRLGIKVGMRVQDGKRLCPGLIVLRSDPNKYRSVHLLLSRLLREYTDDLAAKSIDEFVLNLEGYPALKLGMDEVAREIKQRIREEVGESLTVSIGIAPNRFLAKTAASLNKPDGLDTIDVHNHREVYSRLRLTDLCGIKRANALRLHTQDIYSVLHFYNASARQLHAAFESVVGYHWHIRLHGWEVDDVDFGRKTFGNSFALPEGFREPEELAPILTKLVEKTGRRMRHAEYVCRGVHVALAYRDGTHWHRGMTLTRALYNSQDIFKEVYKLLWSAPYRKPVAILAENVFNLQSAGVQQLDLFDDVNKKWRLADTLDTINEREGDFMITPFRMLGTHDLVPDRISFGAVKELEEELLYEL